jgi:hypothetical protein
MLNPKGYILILFLGFHSLSVNAQAEKFDSIQHGLMLNIFTGSPDSIVLPFLKNHFPYLASRTEPGGWTIYPPVPYPMPKRGTHSVTIEQHPFIQSKHSSAKLELLTQEWSDGLPGIDRTRIWINFPDKQGAKMVYDSVVALFRSTGAKIENGKSANFKKVTIWRNNNSDDWDVISLVVKRLNRKGQYAILVLFAGDDGEPW